MAMIDSLSAPDALITKGRDPTKVRNVRRGMDVGECMPGP
jgi:hypothetical protein